MSLETSIDQLNKNIEELIKRFDSNLAHVPTKAPEPVKTEALKKAKEKAAPPVEVAVAEVIPPDADPLAGLFADDAPTLRTLEEVQTLAAQVSKQDGKADRVFTVVRGLGITKISAATAEQLTQIYEGLEKLLS